jgi:hypothetical protein
MKLNPIPFPDRPRNGSFGNRQKSQNAVDIAIKMARDELCTHNERQGAFMRLVECLHPQKAGMEPASYRNVFLINRLKHLAERQVHWIRPCETWRPEASNIRLATRSLAHHLFANYPVPNFMDSAWDIPSGPAAFLQQVWFIRLGRGASFRSLNLPFVLTRAMEHYVRQAPDHFTAMQALRYGETRGLGGSEALAREVAGSRLGHRIEYPQFWRTVIGFLVAQREAALEHVGPIADFIQANKFPTEVVLTGGHVDVRAPTWPDFSIKGRTLKSVLRLVTEWHGDLAAGGGADFVSWRKSGIEGYHIIERREDDDDFEWIIEELSDSDAVLVEGREMRHCVYSYYPKCWRGETTIWSLRLRVNSREKRMATIEVNPRRRSIIQLRAKCNRPVVGRSSEIIRQWGEWAGLHFDLRI